MADKLTGKQRRFIAEYRKDFNATAAAIRAGYSKNGAEVQGHHNLRNPKISAALATSQARMAEKLEISVERVAREFAVMGFANMADYAEFAKTGDLSLLTRDQAAAIQEIVTEMDGDTVTRVRFKLASKAENLTQLGKHLGMFLERRLNINVALEDLSDDELQRRIRATEQQIAELIGGRSPAEAGMGEATRH